MAWGAGNGVPGTLWLAGVARAGMEGAGAVGAWL